jgi:magnesium transporter
MNQELILQELEKQLNVQAGNEAILETIQSLKPYDLSELINQLSFEHKQQVITLLPTDIAAETLEYLEPEDQYEILHQLNDELASLLLNEMSSDAVVDMLLAIHPYQAETLLKLLPDDYRKQINELMSFPEHTAGALMTLDYISARSHWSVAQTLEHIRKVGHEAEIISYIYVVNSRGKLVGVVSLKEVILTDPHIRLFEIVTKDVISVPADLEQEEVATILSRYDFYALPVVDHQNRLLGIITFDDVVDVIQEEATEDFQKLGGSQPLTEPYFKTTVFDLFRKRIVWLLILFIGGAYTSNVLSSFQDIINRVVALSFFIPLLIGTGGNTGSQIVTTLVRALGVGEVKFKDLFKVLKKEIITGILLGVALGMVAYLRAWLLEVQTNICYVVALSAFSIVIWSSLVSAILPLILHRLRIDPAVVSGPLISTLVDGTGLIIYFSIAKLILHL